MRNGKLRPPELTVNFDQRWEMRAVHESVVRCRFATCPYLGCWTSKRREIVESTCLPVESWQRGCCAKLCLWFAFGRLWSPLLAEKLRVIAPAPEPELAALCRLELSPGSCPWNTRGSPPGPDHPLTSLFHCTAHFFPHRVPAYYYSRKIPDSGTTFLGFDFFLLCKFGQS